MIEVKGLFHQTTIGDSEYGYRVDYFPQQSRDHALAQVVQCQCTICPVNVNGHCETPAVIKIGSGGQCEMAQRSFEKLRSK